MLIIIENIKLEDTKINSCNYNSNNHWVDNQIPEDYDYICSELTKTKHWIDKFHKTYRVINFDIQDVYWMREAFFIAHHHMKIPEIYSEDLEETLEKFKDVDISQGYFIRAENISLKYGKHGCGPYTSIKNIIESLVTTSIKHREFNKDTTECKIYLLPWLDIDEKKEFRVFVYKNKITCISPQDIYDRNEWLESMSHDEIKNIVNQIKTFHEKIIKRKIDYIDNYSVDLCFIDDKLYFIEINPFGKEYSSGSALFHWIRDEKILYNDENDNIIFRYTIE